MSEKKKNPEASLKLNFATSIVLLVVLIPLLYTVVVNLQKTEPQPEIKPLEVRRTQLINPATAIQTALQVATAKPDYSTYIELGLAYYNAQQYAESIKAWEKALEYNPKGDLAYNNIAAAYGALKNWDAEIEICKRALAINPKLELAKRNLDWATKMKNTK